MEPIKLFLYFEEPVVMRVAGSGPQEGQAKTQHTDNGAIMDRAVMLTGGSSNQGDDAGHKVHGVADAPNEPDDPATAAFQMLCNPQLAMLTTIDRLCQRVQRGEQERASLADELARIAMHHMEQSEAQASKYERSLQEMRHKVYKQQQDINRSGKESLQAKRQSKHLEQKIDSLHLRIKELSRLSECEKVQSMLGAWPQEKTLPDDSPFKIWAVKVLALEARLEGLERQVRDERRRAQSLERQLVQSALDARSTAAKTELYNNIRH